MTISSRSTASRSSKPHLGVRDRLGYPKGRTTLMYGTEHGGGLNCPPPCAVAIPSVTPVATLRV